MSTIDENFKQLLISENTISERKTQINTLRHDYERKVALLNNIITDEESVAQSYRNLILEEMEQDGLVETEISMFKVRRKKCVQSVVIDDEATIPGNYIITKTPKVTTAPDKVLIGKLLRAGHEITGARLSDEKYELEIKGK